MKKLLSLHLLFVCIFLLSGCYTQSDIDSAREQGYDDGQLEGYVEGTDDGYDSGFESGYDFGYDEGYSAGYQDGSNEGFDDGHDNGYDTGYEDCIAEYETRVLHAYLSFRHIDAAFQYSLENNDWYDFILEYDEHITDIFSSEDGFNVIMDAFRHTFYLENPNATDTKVLIDTFGQDLFSRNGVPIK